jgi:hypothetical protein
MNRVLPGERGFLRKFVSFLKCEGGERLAYTLLTHREFVCPSIMSTIFAYSEKPYRRIFAKSWTISSANGISKDI